MSDIGVEQLDAALSALGDQLAVAGETVHLVVIGGSGLLAIDAITPSKWTVPSSRPSRCPTPSSQPRRLLLETSGLMSAG